MFFEPGDGPFKTYSIRGVNVGLLVCFDWIFPEATRILSLQGMDVLAHASNLVLPFCQTAMLARSIENRIFTITSNRIGTEENMGISLSFTGLSQIISPRMEVLAKASEDKEELQFAKIDASLAKSKSLNERNNLFLDRRTELYSKLTSKNLTEE